MLRLVYDPSPMDADLSGGDEGYDVTRSLDTAVILSLFCDARAGEGDPILPGGDRRGWWAEGFFEDNDVWGSKLWQVLQGKATQAALVQARRSCERALDWMIEDGVAKQVDVETWWIEGRQGYMGIRVVLHKPDELAPQYVGSWEVSYAVG